MTLERAAKDYKAYLSLLKIFDIPYPVPEDRRAELDRRIAEEAERVKAKVSRLPARCRRVLLQIVSLAEDRA